MNNQKATVLIVSGLVLLTALGDAWALCLFALAGLAWLTLAQNLAHRRRVKNLIAALVAFACALVIADVAGRM